MLVQETKTVGNYSKAQKWLIIFLIIWISLTIARQSFDLIGKLWLPVVFNLLQVKIDFYQGLFIFEIMKKIKILFCVQF